MDKKARNILFRTYWNKGWIDEKDCQTSAVDFEYAKAKGLMFDPPPPISHDQCLEKIFEILPTISMNKAARAFVSSLSTRRLDWRSGLASWFIARQLRPHSYDKVVSGHSYRDGKISSTHYTCGTCRDLKYGIIGHEFYDDVDLNIMNFERIKWGGVRHGQLDYTLFDLKQFQAAEIPEPRAEDIEIFREILAKIENSAPEDYPGTLEKNLAGLFKSTKDERKALIEVLACIDVLKPGSYDRPGRGKNDWVFVEYWRGEDKYNRDAVEKYFSEYL